MKDRLPDSAGRPPSAALRSGRRWSRTAFIAAVVSALPLASALPAFAAVITVRDMARGFSATRSQCAAIPQAVWVSAGGRSFCIRYYLSNAGGHGIRPAVFLQGDRPSGRFDRRTGRFIADAAARDVDTRSLAGFSARLSQQVRTTAIYLARIGVDGSTGHQDMRRSTLETFALNQALDAIKRRHGFEGYHLAGQSAGAANIAGLLSLRTDIGCAVMGAAPLAPRTDGGRPGIDPWLAVLDPTDRIPAIIRSHSGRIIVVTDPLDRTVRADSQTTFVRELIRAGGRAEQYFVEAKDTKRHVVTPYTTSALAACMDGRSPQETADRLAQLVQRAAAGRAGAASGHADRLAFGPARTPPAVRRTRDITPGRLQHGPRRKTQP